MAQDLIDALFDDGNYRFNGGEVPLFELELEDPEVAIVDEELAVLDDEAFS